VISLFIPPINYPGALSLAQAQFTLGRRIDHREICKKAEMTFLAFDISKKVGSFSTKEFNWQN